jgi:hypothetical protein
MRVQTSLPIGIATETIENEIFWRRFVFVCAWQRLVIIVGKD